MLLIPIAFAIIIAQFYTSVCACVRACVRVCVCVCVCVYCVFSCSVIRYSVWCIINFFAEAIHIVIYAHTHTKHIQITESENSNVGLYDSLH